MANIRLIDLLPQPYYQDVYEMVLLMQIEQYQLDALQNAIDKAQNNFFAIVADEDGLKIFEQMLGIAGDDYLDLEARRYNVIARLLPPKPITLRGFNEIIKALNIDASISVKNFEAVVQTNTTDTQALKRLNSLMKSCLPANLTFQALNIVSSSTPAPTKHGTGALLATKVTSQRSVYAERG
ncbi:DUF2313 domain-containing protein [Lactococcus lactis]|uniref:DUF2313 domain-containing protein n=1 Tax=Lactococcus lactis TaxID=1358 RepID=A0A6B3RVV7_9LACT|nr:putative phage tail protein [Lactococcus lactis]MCT1174177.1 DUF2313 domain-containing protein [Lactococcus lactis]MCT1186478.1 DUF2313 domain-containing protein [Lactococcus lactis]MCT1189576.1 DUF2313 domain-containing protein [Lactococcus lactis]MCT1195248.1 DUF2313 domain-containing protein [Lactococcus lactis]NEX49336.1 DUF2313 domain-containing protein [Lactococcus lactis]